jgi:hypothetical protein
MTLNRGRLDWGVFFIVLGAVPLAYSQGAVSVSTLSDAWRLWPLVLVGIGLGIVLYRSPAAFIGGLVVAACLGMVLGSLLVVGPQFGCGHASGSSRMLAYDGSFGGPGRVELNLQCGSASVTGSSDASWHVRASNTVGNDASVSWTSTSLSVNSSHQGNWFVNRGDDHWDVSLPSGADSLSASIDAGDATFSLAGVNLRSASFSLNAGSLRLDLTNGRVGSFSLSTNAGSSRVTLDGSSSTSGSISTNAGSTAICAPSGLGLRIRSSESLGSNNFASAGLVRVGGTWQTSGYDTATYRADFSVSTSVGSVALNPAGGCK